VLRIRVAYPGSRIRLFSIPDHGSEFFHLGSRIRIKEFKYFNPKNGFKALENMIRVVHREFRILDPDPDCYLSRSPDPGVKKAPVPGSGSATLTESGPDSLYEDMFYHLQYYPW
jgi:hypothetical protein